MQNQSFNFRLIFSYFSNIVTVQVAHSSSSKQPKMFNLIYKLDEDEY